MVNNITSKSSVRVKWSDKIENYSKEHIKNIKSHVKNKYNVEHVRVDFYPTNKLQIGITDLSDTDVENINRPETQEKIILQYLQDNNIDITVEDIKRLNKKVETNDLGFVDTKDNKWKIKNITIENFLSYKDRFTIDFEKLQGITLIQGQNFSGKTVIANDAIRFLLFNTTSKTKKADEVINRYIDVDFAKVEGELLIDGIEYKISREVSRKWKKDKTSYTVSTKLDFATKNFDGEYELLNGDQRQSTEKIIRENIGNEKEFLMTVLCTQDNIFDLVKSLPTERGLILAKFLGLDIFEKKEEIAKKMFSDWKLKSSIDKYNSADLNKNISDNEEIIKSTNLKIIEIENELEILGISKNKVVSEKDEYLKYIHNDIDSSMSHLNEKFFKDKIENIKTLISNKEAEEKNISSQITPINGIFDKVDYEHKVNERRLFEKEINNITNNISNEKNLIIKLKNGEKCPTCGQSLKDVDHTNEIKEKTKNIENLEIELKSKKESLEKLLTVIEGLEQTKQKINEQDILTLKRDNTLVEIENLSMKLSREQENLNKFIKDLDKIEKNKELYEKIRLKEIEITEFSNKELFKNRELQNCNNIINNSNKSIKDYNELIQTIKKEEHISKVFGVYITMMGKNGISKTIIKNTVPVLNIELNRLLSDSAEFNLNIEVNEKNNEVEFWLIDNKTDIKSLFNSGSGYEKTIGSLALRVVLSKVNSLPKPSLLNLDEVFGTVSNENMELIKTFLDKISRNIDNIFMITHNEMTKEWADHILTAEKINNISTLK
jgi:DNA repair exonuclease SbcCD ATPase subunit